MSELKIQAWSAVNKALQLDSDGLHPEAYKKYLEGIRKLCIYLEEETDILEFEINPLARQKCMQVVSVMKKSLERLEQFSSNNEQINNNGVLNRQENISRNSSSCSLGFDYFNLNLAGMSQSNAISSSDRRAELSPIEKARRENGLIYRAYQARCQLVKDSKKRANLYLELHRKLTENIIVARAKEAAARQKQIEKEKEILELAAKKLDLQSNFLDKVTNNTEDWEKLLLYAQIIQYEEKEIWPSNLREKLKKFPENQNFTSEAIKLTLSTSNHPLSLWVCKSQNQLLERIKFFLKENDHVIGKISLPDIAIGDSFSSTTSLPQALNSVKPHNFEEMEMSLNTQESATTLDSTKVSLSKMPLNKMWVEDDLLSLFDPLAGKKLSSQVPYSSFIDPEQEQTSALRTRLNEIINDTVKAIEMLVQILCATYELTTDIAQEICYQMAENFIFQGVWPQLLNVFRIINYKAERNMAIVMERLSTSPPEEVGIPSYFNLSACQDEALAGLRRLITLHTPIAKLHQLVHIARTVCSKKTHSASGRPFGADDLIGIMCYLLVQTKMPHLLSEFEALEQLVPHRYLMGEEGYALTSHLTAIKYLESQIDVQSTYFYDVGEDVAQNI